MKIDCSRQTWTERTEISISGAPVGAKKLKPVICHLCIRKKEKQNIAVIPRHCNIKLMSILIKVLMCGVCLCPCLKVLIRAPLLETVRQWPSSPGLVYASLIGQVYATLTLVSTAHAHTRIFRLFSSLCPGLGASRPELAAPSNSALTVQHSTKQYSHKNTQTLSRSLKEYSGEPYK